MANGLSAPAVFWVLFRHRARLLFRNRKQFIMTIFFPFIIVAFPFLLSLLAKTAARGENKQDIESVNLSTVPDTAPTSNSSNRNCSNIQSRIAYFPNGGDQKEFLKKAMEVKRKTNETAFLFTCMKGFRSEMEAVEWIAENKQDSEIRGVIVDLKGISQNEYVLMVGGNSTEKSTIDLIQAQLLIETAILEQNGPNSISATVWKSLDAACQLSHKFSTAAQVQMIGSTLEASSLANQLVTEKTTRMREYLRIMGASSGMQKLSWLTFYGVVCLPSSIAIGCLLKFLQTDTFQFTNAGVLVFLCFFYCLANLAFGYFLGSVLKGGTSLIYFGYMAFSWLFSYSLADPVFFHGTQTLLGVHVLSLVFPYYSLFIGLKYIATWENLLLGAQFSNAMSSPFYTDDYGGFGNCLIYLSANTVLFLLAGWYFETVFPGQYGMKRPFYFPFTRSYWFRKEDVAESADPPSESGSSQNSNSQKSRKSLTKAAGVSLKNLTKNYGRFTAVDSLTLNFDCGKVTSLLGENGAGKSTTLNMVVGLLAPTEGQIHVNGIRMRGGCNVLKVGLGYVPQYDILYPTLTVEDHFKLYSQLCGLDKNEAMETATSMLDELGISHVLKTKAGVMSGGERRKFSLICALLAKPLCLILDEPTSGVDPFSRRQIWGAILRARAQGTTIVLSTHHLDEAEILSEKIAIIGGGQMLCKGTPLDLKEEYSLGYKFTIAVNKSHLIPNLVKMVQEHLSHAVVEHETKHEVIFAVPRSQAQSQHMIDCLKRLEMGGGEFTVSDFGIAEPTMDEVFLSATKRSVDDDYEIDKKTAKEISSMEIETCSGGSRIWSQMLGLIIKRGLLLYRAKTNLVLQFLIPMLFCIVTIMSASIKQEENAMKRIFVQHRYYPNIFFVDGNKENVKSFTKSATKYGIGPICTDRFDEHCVSKTTKGDSFGNDLDEQPLTVEPKCDKDCGKSCARSDLRTMLTKLKLPHGDVLVNLAADDTSAIIATNETLDGFVYAGLALKDGTAVIMSEEYRALSAINAFNNALLREKNERASIVAHVKVSQARIQYEAMQDPAKGGMAAVAKDMSTTSGMMYAFTFLPLASINFLLHEKHTKTRQLQLSYGVNRINYILTNYLCDVVFTLLGLVPVTLILLAVESLRNLIQFLFPVFLFYCFAAVAHFYLLSTMFKRFACAIVLLTVQMLILQTIASLSAVLGVFPQVCKVYDTEKTCAPTKLEGTTSMLMNIGDYMSWPLSFFPLFALPAAIYHAYLHLEDGMIPLLSGDDTQSKMFHVQFLGRYLLVMFMSIGIWLVLAVLVQGRRGGCAKEPPVTASQDKVADPDVVEERRRAHHPAAVQEHSVVVQSLVKAYKGQSKIAVDDVSFVVPPKECFGLLGVNGAGKSTTFKVLARELDANSGTAIVMGQDTKKSPKQVARVTGYCPQDNVLFENLSVTENLNLFARFAGLSKEAKDVLIPFFLDGLALREHEYKKAGNLSGGNKRKLQMAIAMLDFRAVILLDEPTSGMDPGARMRTWEIVRLATRGRQCSVILTSHSMQECEELCDRLLIMVLGKVQCIGAVQNLKSKLGNKYTVKLRVPLNDPTTAEAVKAFLLEKTMYTGELQPVPGLKLAEQHETQLEFEIERSRLDSVANLFSMVMYTRDMFKLSSFAISQASLEHVFVKYAETLEMEEKKHLHNKQGKSTATTIHITQAGATVEAPTKGRKGKVNPPTTALIGPTTSPKSISKSTPQSAKSTTITKSVESTRKSSIEELAKLK